MDASRTCRRCGTPISPDAQACPRCLFALAMPPAGSTGPDASHVRTGSPSARPEPPTQDEIARALPDLDGFELLGRGGMGVVYKARQRKLDRWIALKVLPRALGADPAFRERFLREARALARLQHANIVAVHEFGEADGLFHLVMELVDGVDLRHVMRERRLAPREALAIVRALCDALQFAHDEGVVHRDIKPENVLVDRSGRVKIADFGLAKVVGLAAGANLTEAGQVMGTPHYMAPEQLERPGEVDHRADLFALGVVMYEMLTGSLPRGAFEVPSRRIEVDVRLDEIVLKALEREPARRYQQALEVKTDVVHVEATPGGAAASDGAATAGAGVASAQDTAHARTRTRRLDPLRGVRGFALCTMFWIVAAVMWNQGAFVFGLSFAGLSLVVGLLLHGRIQERPILAAELGREGAGARSARALTAIVSLGLGLAFVSLAHFTHWERGTRAWWPAYRDPHGLFDTWRLDPFGLLRAAGGTPAVDQDVAVQMLASSIRGAGLDQVGISPWLLFCAGFAVLVFALYVGVRPRARTPGRREAWEVSFDVGAHLIGSLVVLWVAAPAVALRSDQRLESVERRFTVDGEPDDVARMLQAALARAGLSIDVDQRAVAVDTRTAAVLADAHVLRAAAESPFERWSTSFAGPQRETPQVWVAVARAAGASESAVILRAGLYEARSRRGEDARASLAELEALVRAR